MYIYIYIYISFVFDQGTVKPRGKAERKQSGPYPGRFLCTTNRAERVFSHLSYPETPSQGTRLSRCKCDWCSSNKLVSKPGRRQSRTTRLQANKQVTTGGPPPRLDPLIAKREPWKTMIANWTLRMISRYHLGILAPFVVVGPFRFVENFR